MATLPRPSRILSPLYVGSKKLTPDFDAGINTSNAWTGHLDGGDSPINSASRIKSRKWLSESNAKGLIPEEDVDELEESSRPARALYSFQGKAEFRELTVEAGDVLEVVKEDVGEGWSLVKDPTGELGLLPKAYYTVREIFSDMSTEIDLF